MDDVDRLEENRSHRVIPPEELLDDRLQGDQVTSRPHVVDKEEVEALTEGEKCCEGEQSQFENHGHSIDLPCLQLNDLQRVRNIGYVCKAGQVFCNHNSLCIICLSQEKDLEKTTNIVVRKSFPMVERFFLRHRLFIVSWSKNSGVPLSLLVLMYFKCTFAT